MTESSVAVPPEAVYFLRNLSLIPSSIAGLSIVPRAPNNAPNIAMFVASSVPAISIANFVKSLVRTLTLIESKNSLSTSVNKSVSEFMITRPFSLIPA